MTIEGVGEDVPTKRVGKNNFEVRADGFGTMTDFEVAEYKKARPRRYGQSEIWDAIEILQDRLDAIEGA